MSCIGDLVLSWLPASDCRSAMQDSDAKLSKRQLEEVVHSVTKLTALQPMRSASQYATGAQLRVRRADRPESCFELLPYFRRLNRWLHVSRPVTAPSPLNLRRLRADGSAGAVNEGSGGAGPQTGKRRRGGTAEDPRRRREIAAAKQARDAIKQRDPLTSMRGVQGQQASTGPTGVSTPVARRRRIQEMSSKPVWEHTPVWEGWLSVQQTYGVRVKYPTLQLAIPVIKINRGVVGAMKVESSIHVTLSADGTVVNQLWEHNGGVLFSAVLALANRGQAIVRQHFLAAPPCCISSSAAVLLPVQLLITVLCTACACVSHHKVTAKAMKLKSKLRLLPPKFGCYSVSAAVRRPTFHRCSSTVYPPTLFCPLCTGLGSVGVLGILAAQLGHTSGF